MSDRKRRLSQMTGAESLPLGDFRLDGSFNPRAPRPPKGDCLFWFIDSLVTKRRREPEVSPRDFAMCLARTQWTKAFPGAHRWAFLTLGTDWPMVVPHSAAEATVKACGCLGPHWDRGLFSAEAPPLGPRVSQEDIALMIQGAVATVATPIGP